MSLRGERDKVGRDDMITLSELSEDSMLSNLKQRYASSIIYTYIGAVLISINPYKDIGCFTKSNITKYKGKQAFEVPPHVFSLAEETYKALLTEQRNQSIIISGESGAGKTEAAKGIMQYLAAITGRGPTVDKVKNVILESNPLLESFGNAKTLRNNNSSRFGKYIEIQFDARGDPNGGCIRNYLLEKSRVVTQIKGERNFHIFYQLFNSSNKAKWGLSGGVDAFRYLRESGCSTVDGINDGRDYESTRHAMKSVGITDPQQDQLFKLLAAILHIGNVEFKSGGQGKAECSVTNQQALKQAADMLDVPEQSLQTALLFRGITSGSARGTSYQVGNNAEQAGFARDALAKGIYSRMFDWIVATTNKSMEYKGSGNTIGILDIYGFEIFDTNSFEQLCINYVNETLHQIFIELTLKAEQEEYVAEGIPWTNVDYVNNKPTVELLAGKPMGVFRILDEECLFPNGTDQTYIEKLKRQFGNNRHFQPDGGFKFTVKHYAGDVRYNVTNFLEKNRDTLFDDLKDLCMMSRNTLLVDVFKLAEASVQQRNQGGRGGKARPITAGMQFQKSVDELMKLLYACQPHYIRTIKPNDEKR